MRHSIEVAEIEFEEGGNTIWIHSPLGATTMRIKTKGKITTETCGTSPVSHCDLIVEEDISFCLSDDAVRTPEPNHQNMPETARKQQ